MIVAITGRAVRGLVALSCRRPIVTVAACVLLAVLSMAYTHRALTIQTSKLLLLPERARYVTLFRAYAEDFGTMGDLAVVVRGPTVAESVAFAEALVARLRAGPARFERIAHRVDPRSLKGGALLYLPLGQIQRLHDTFAEHHELLEAFVARPTLDQLLEGVNQQVGAGFVAHVFDVGLQEAPVSADMRLLRELVGLMERRLDGDRAYRSPWGALLAGGGDSEVGYLLSENRQLLFILLTPAVKGEDFTAVREALRFVRKEIAGLRAQHPTVTAGVTGAPALYNDELAKAFEDSELAGVIASVLTLLLLVVAFRQIQQPVLMLVVLGVSLAWALAMVALTIGYLTVFSVMFLSIVIGIGIDYGMYFLYRYQEERAAGHDLGPAIALTAERNGPGILASIAAAAATFYVLAITDFKGVREFGFISGTAVLLAGLAMLTMFPALLVLSERRRGARTVPAVPAGEVLVLERLARRPRRVLIPAAAAALLAAVSLPWLEVDYNILNLQAKGTESVEWEKIILKTAGWSGFPAVTTAGSLDELATRHAAFARLPSVSEVKSVVTLIPDRQAEKIALIQRLAPLVPELRVTAPPEVDLPRLVAAVAGLKRRLDVAATADLPRALAEEVTATVRGVSALLDRLRGGDPAALTAGLGDLQRDLYRDFTGQFEILRESLQPAPIAPADLPEEIRRRFVGTSGRFLLEVHPRVDIWSREGAQRFVGDLRSVDPEVTGHPVIAFESINLMERAYRQGALYAFILVAGLALVMLRRLRESALVLVPLLLGGLWGLGLMHLFGQSFNLGNVWGIPLVIGAGAEFGLSIVLRYREAREHGGPLFPRSTMASVLVNGLTTIAGFGSLLVAHHQGVASLGMLLVIGTVTCLVASLVVLPVLLRAASKPVT